MIGTQQTPWKRKYKCEIRLYLKFRIKCTKNTQMYMQNTKMCKILNVYKIQTYGEYFNLINTNEKSQNKHKTLIEDNGEEQRWRIQIWKIFKISQIFCNSIQWLPLFAQLCQYQMPQQVYFHHREKA